MMSSSSVLSVIILLLFVACITEVLKGSDAALDNCLLNIDFLPDTSVGEFAPLSLSECNSTYQDDADRYPQEIYTQHEERQQKGAGTACDFDPMSKSVREQTFADMLKEQIGWMYLSPETSALCEYLIDCLNDRGYLVCGLEDIAKETGVTGEEAAKALHIVQTLHPAGVGARSLKECLILQLQESGRLNEHTAKLVGEGLPVLSKNDMRTVASLLDCDMPAAVRAADIIRSLNPIPSRGYKSGTGTVFIVPDASVFYEHGGYVITMNDYCVPGLSLNREYCALLHHDGSKESTEYYKAQLPLAKALIRSIDNRKSTIQRLLECIVALQPSFFRYGTGLKPMTLSDVADKLRLNVSTVSRAVRNKYILCAKGTVSLRALFSQGVDDAAGESVSVSAIKEQLEQIIKSEDHQEPLTDDALCSTMNARGVSISRRTIAKYRDELGIMPASRRRKDQY